MSAPNQPPLPQTVGALRDQFLADHRPWVVAYSGGKDSTLVLQLVYDLIVDLGPLATKPVHVVASDTRVEAPNVEEYLADRLSRVASHARANGLPVHVHRVQPTPAQSFWGNLIGKGYPSPTRWFRWCTTKMKIKPSRAVIDGIVRELAEVKSARKQAQREELEAAINRHFRVLMTSHHLIDRIQVDEDFGLRYPDRDGRPIGMGSLSAGMKQLMATALLWALSEASGKQVPLVVDTPLARIDLAHQEAILRHYYPNAAAQVIVLPTDAELDARKLQLIAGHVYGSYRLTNLDGEHTVPEQVTVAELIQGG